MRAGVNRFLAPQFIDDSRSGIPRTESEAEFGFAATKLDCLDVITARGLRP